MKKSLTFVLAAVAMCSPAAAFTASSSHLHTTTSLRDTRKTNTEDYLRNLWEDEKHIERDLVVQEIINGKTEEDVTKHLVTEMLETALEHVKILEKEKSHQAKLANDLFEHAASDERVLAEFAEEDEDLLPPVPMDDYLKSRLHQAEEEELQALKDEDEYVAEYEELRKKEGSIKYLLDQMKKMES
jgi:hypothetical protein